jgi:hypothetical protein
MPYQTQGKTVLQLKTSTLAKLKQSNYDRYSSANILESLNDASMEVARRLKCLHSFAIIVVKALYSQYPQPSMMMSPKAAFFYQNNPVGATGPSYIQLKFKGREWLDQFMAGWRQMRSDPWICYPGDSIGNLRKLGFAPTPINDGTAFTIVPDTGIFESGTGLTTSGNIIGLNSVANATVCTDINGNFVASGIQVGMVALNVNDGSQGQISVVTATTFTVTLAGGTNNVWALGDNYTILAGEYGVVTGLESSDEQYIFSSDLGEITSITNLKGNVVLEFYARPIDLAFDTQYPEVPIETHQYLPDYAVWVLKRSAPRGSVDEKEATIALQNFDRFIQPVPIVTLDSAMETSRIRYNW